MEIIKDAKTLGAAIKRVGKAIRSMQDKVHELAVSAMFHFYEHGDSTYMTLLCSEITKCHGTRKEKLIGYMSATCGVNWDNENLRFKKSKDNEFTRESGNEFPLERLESERWYEFVVDTEVPSWLLKKVLKQANAQIANHTDEAKSQIVDAWEEFQALQATMREVGLGETPDEGWGDTPDFLVKAA